VGSMALRTHQKTNNAKSCLNTLWTLDFTPDDAARPVESSPLPRRSSWLSLRLGRRSLSSYQSPRRQSPNWRQTLQQTAATGNGSELLERTTWSLVSRTLASVARARSCSRDSESC